MRLANAVYERARSTLHAGWCDDEDERRIKVADNNKKLDGRFFVCLSLSLSLALCTLCTLRSFSRTSFGLAVRFHYFTRGPKKHLTQNGYEFSFQTINSVWLFGFFFLFCCCFCLLVFCTGLFLHLIILWSMSMSAWAARIKHISETWMTKYILIKYKAFNTRINNVRRLSEQKNTKKKIIEFVMRDAHTKC